MDSKQIRIYEVLRAAIDQYVELEGTLQGKHVVFVGSVSITKFGSGSFTAEFKNSGLDTTISDEPSAIYYSETGRLIKNEPVTTDLANVLMDHIDSIQVVFD